MAGRQGPGDQLVARAVEKVGRELEGQDQQAVRLLLFRSLIDVELADIDAGRSPATMSDTIADERIVASRVRSLPPEVAIVLLLSTLEGFDPEEVAFIMRLTPAEALSRLEAAQAVLEAQAATDVLIIEDEPVIAMDIAGIVRQAGHRVLGIAATQAEAVEMATSATPGLVLADIRLADDSSGIKAVDEIRARRLVPVIFITAYPERLLDDQRAEPSLLITKPFNDHLLKVAIAQALEIDHALKLEAAAS